MKIVVLDGYALNPGDLNWEGLKKLGDLDIHDRTESQRILERAKDAELVLINKTPLSSETLRQLPKLKYVGVLATGYNCVDVKAAKELGIVVTSRTVDSAPLLRSAIPGWLCKRGCTMQPAVQDWRLKCASSSALVSTVPASPT